MGAETRRVERRIDRMRRYLLCDYRGLPKSRRYTRDELEDGTAMREWLDKVAAANAGLEVQSVDIMLLPVEDGSGGLLLVEAAGR